MGEQHKIMNPIIPGFYPDPSICRVGGDFYLACSSFEMYPGIPIFHSRDLANWEQICYAMTMENGFHTSANMGTGGVMAPTIRYHDGIFYIINCNFADKGNFYITAENPAGPWSEPHWITDIPDIDCSLFFDDDGSCYLVAPGDDPSEDNHRAFFLTPYDIKNGRACGERKKIWNSALRKAWAPEAPHIYHIGEYYYLMIAEGGTEHFHSVMIARSSTIDGWYEGYRGNPVMTHRNLGLYYPIDNVGHADLVDTPDGNWYAVLLGSRLLGGQHHNFGRETFLCPVTWERGWPVFSPGCGKVELEYPADDRLPWTPCRKEPERDDFDSEELEMHLSFWGTPYQDFWKIKNSRLYLTCLPRPMVRQLKGFSAGAVEIIKDDCISFLGRRQRLASFMASFAMEFEPQKAESAGLAIIQAANHQIRLEKKNVDGSPCLCLMLVTTEQKGLPYLPGYEAITTEKLLESHAVGSGSLKIRMEADWQDLSFFWQEEGKEEMRFETKADAALINPEEIGGMIGTVIGLFASSNGDSDSANAASFDYFEIKPL